MTASPRNSNEVSNAKNAACHPQVFTKRKKNLRWKKRFPRLTCTCLARRAPVYLRGRPRSHCYKLGSTLQRKRIHAPSSTHFDSELALPFHNPLTSAHSLRLTSRTPWIPHEPLRHSRTSTLHSSLSNTCSLHCLTVWHYRR